MHFTLAAPFALRHLSTAAVLPCRLSLPLPRPSSTSAIPVVCNSALRGRAIQSAVARVVRVQPIITNRVLSLFTCAGRSTPAAHPRIARDLALPPRALSSISYLPPSPSASSRSMSTAAAAAAAAQEGIGGGGEQTHHGGLAIRGGAVTSESIEMTTDGRTRLASFLLPSGKATVGVVKDRQIWRLSDCIGARDGDELLNFDSMQAVIQDWEEINERLDFQKLSEGQGRPLSSCHLLAPLPSPSGPLLCIGKNYEAHVKEVDTWKTAPEITQPSIPKHPIVFTKSPHSVIGPGEAIRVPIGWSEAVDYETELALIIGRAGRAIKQEDAIKHVFGYTILNDVTARDVQKRHQQWFLGKSCDTFCPMGPWIVLASEINGQDVAIQGWVNEELRQSARTSQLLFSIPSLIATISSAITLRPGDIIATGTPAGVGSGFTPPRHLKPGDLIRMRVEGIGELVNTVE